MCQRSEKEKFSIYGPKKGVSVAVAIDVVYQGKIFCKPVRKVVVVSAPANKDSKKATPDILI